MIQPVGGFNGPSCGRRALGKLEDLYLQFPRLFQHQHRITSDATDKYNCVAWTQDDQGRWWEPGFYWPVEADPHSDPNRDLKDYVAMFESLGYEKCADGEYEEGRLKIALYASGESFFHVARQLRDGSWSSKGGTNHDFWHEKLESLEGSIFNASVAQFMSGEDSGESLDHLYPELVIVADGHEATAPYAADDDDELPAP